jgi:hypothetical protein
MSDKSILEYVSEVSEFNHISGIVQDETLDKALGYVVMLTMKPDIPPAKAVPLIIQLQAYGAYFSTKANYYTNIEKGKAGTESNIKKNIYFTMSANMDNIVAALKYTLRTNGL